MAGREAMSGGSQRRATSSRRSDDSKDEEHYTGELMGKWLTDLPPTMPFHRGQVSRTASRGERSRGPLSALAAVLLSPHEDAGA
jgi:hypothetical protein